MGGKLRCPICKREVSWEGNPFKPFCSQRCKLIDLGRWLNEEYVIKGEEAAEYGTGEKEARDG